MINIKIYNPKTKRYVNQNSKNGKNILDNFGKVSNKKPLDSKYDKVYDKGLISEKPIEPLLLELQNILGEFCDLYSVVNNNKKLCGMDFSNYSKDRLKNYYKDKGKLNEIDLINKIIDYSNSNNIHYIHNTKRGGMYIKTIFFFKKNEKLVFKLMKILWFRCDFIQNNYQYQFALGYLFGYDMDNIIYFLKTTYNYDISLSEIKYIIDNINNMSVPFEDLQNNNIIYVEHIEYL